MSARSLILGIGNALGSGNRRGGIDPDRIGPGDRRLVLGLRIGFRTRPSGRPGGGGCSGMALGLGSASGFVSLER